MKDSMIKHCQHSLSEDVMYKEVVVIGNGPSGMVTSFMLAGNVPYLKRVPEDLPIDDMLRARLSNLPEEQSLYETDLMELAEGLEGRSQNPIPLLMDNLFRPCADLGIEADPLIEWRYEADKQIDHIVLGRGPPGGAWHTFPPAVRTLSPAAWLALPPHAPRGRARLSARAVAVYARRYVHANRLQKYFRSNVVVTSVTLAPQREERCGAPGCPLAANYLVTGYDKSSGRQFRYQCRRAVVAAGAADRPSTLAPRLAPHALHSLEALERAVHALSTTASLTPTPPTVLIVGSGVSAADAVWLTLKRALNAVHLHRTPADALARLEPAAYPDYCQVYKMMCDGPSGNHPNYTPYPHHMIVDITPQHTDLPLNADEIEDYSLSLKRVKILDLATNETTEIFVNSIAVLIGSRPDLYFLQTNFNLNCIDVKSCDKCANNDSKKKIEDRCFFKNHWMNFKSALGQSIQSCKSRYLNMLEDKCCDKCDIENKIIPYDTLETKCLCDISPLAAKCQCGISPLAAKCQCGISPLAAKCQCDISPLAAKCQCGDISPLANGIGFGVDPNKPVDSRNPIAIDKSTHEVLNAPKNMYALGPLTGDNFMRFIPGGALALAAHIHNDK